MTPQHIFELQKLKMMTEDERKREQENEKIRQENEKIRQENEKLRLLSGMSEEKLRLVNQNLQLEKNLQVRMILFSP